MKRQLTLIVLLFVLLVGASACSLSSQGRQSANGPPEVTTVSLTDGWLIVRPDQAPTAGKLTTTQGADGAKVLEYRVQRDGDEALARVVPLVGFKKVSLKIWSQEKTVAAIGLEDRDKAKFHAPIPLEANHWTSVAFAPADFRLNDDSPVKKTALDPQLVGSSFALVELGKILSLQKPNVIRLADMRIEYGQPQSAALDLPAIIDGTTISITHSGSINHPITVRNGGKLVIKAPCVHLASDINLDHGSMEVDGGTFVVDCKFQHQFHFGVAHESSLVFNGCEFSSPFPNGLDLVDNSRLEIKHAMFPGFGFTASPQMSTIVLEDAVKPGEFIVGKGSHVKVTRCHGVLLWLGLGAGQKVDLALPPTNKVEHFTMPPESKLDLSVDDCDWIFWALIAEPGSDITIRNSNLVATGLAFTSDNPSKIANLRNNTPSKSLHLGLPDRQLSLIDSTVKAWNFYPMKNSQVDIENSTCGEINAFHTARVSMRNSVCDGSGGYIRLSDKSKADFVNCTLNCAVVTTNEGQLTLHHCTINGNTTASDNSSITLHASTIHGQRQELGHGRIRVEP